MADSTSVDLAGAGRRRGDDRRYDAAEAAGPRIVFACAHGAGGHMGDRGMLAVARRRSAPGASAIVRFNFLYKEKGSGRPDPMPRLMETVSAVVARVREELRPDVLIIGGRSMGGRAASMLAAQGFACDGLLLLAYPLHPAGQPEKLRDAHLPVITGPRPLLQRHPRRPVPAAT